MNDSPEQIVPVRTRTKLETHMQTLLLAVVAGLIAWQGVTTLKLSESSARQDERVAHLISLTEHLRQDLRDMDSLHLPRREAEMYRNETHNRIDQLESRVSRLEGSQ